MLNRSKILIDVDSFIRAQTFRSQTVQQNRMPYRRRIQTSESIISSTCRARAAPHRAVSE
jgi:hypothetical protein